MTRPAPLAFPQDRTCPYQPPTGYDSLRTDRPLTRATLYDGRPVWIVTGHALARTLLTDPRLSSDRTRPGFPVVSPRAKSASDRTVPVVGVDDPAHRVQRRMLIPDFTLRRAEALRPAIQRIVDDRIDALLAQGPPADLVRVFALPVPSMVICALLGVPYDDHEFFERQSHRVLRGKDEHEAREARELLRGYLRELIDHKRTAPPGDGVLDTLVHHRLRDGELDREGVVDIAFILLIAGHETTANMISIGTYTLLGHPDRLAELRADPALLPGAVEELMRMLSIVDGLPRVALEDIDAGGVTIQAGEGVIFSTSVVNRDTAAYDDPDALDLHRPTRHHLAFGFGIHQCLGQNLARAELEIALRTLFTRLPGLRLAAPAESVPFKSGDIIQGMLELPVTW
ncbi:cytochrome P450 [Streptomyces roseirectus]|uniref:Cytochrome P450 n=1 Tax=Streptomyces roseirectus TaxID=2768066 RepID=A0A7H0INV9_9ACTN|nr:cytochrome P450 [Streptomyces roseirectus]QNP74475.1 cytochrome P450 [Streptomyces roseirectus]